MTTQRSIEAIDIRIALLRARGETMNAKIIKKLERQKRMLLQGS